MSSGVPRNAQCPCGSGLKFKRCCIGREAALELRLEFLAKIALLPTLFPRLRPAGDEFEAWAARVRAEDPELERLSVEQHGEGIALVGEDERRRIVRTSADELGESWKALCAGLGDQDMAEETLVTAAVLAALAECRILHPEVLELIEDSEDVLADPAEAVALALHATDLWGILEAGQVERALDEIPDDLDDEEYERLWLAVLDEVAACHWSPAHERRLGLLAESVRAQLPDERFPRASAALAAGCELVGADAAFRRRLGAMALADAMVPLQGSALLLAA